MAFVKKRDWDIFSSSQNKAKILSSSFVYYQYHSGWKSTKNVALDSDFLSKASYVNFQVIWIFNFLKKMLQSETFSVISKHCISNTNNSNDSTYWSVSHWDSSTRRAYSPFASVSLLPVHSEWTLTSVVSSLVLRSPFVDPKSPRKSNKVGQQNYEKHFCSSRCYFSQSHWPMRSAIKTDRDKKLFILLT